MRSSTYILVVLATLSLVTGCRARHTTAAPPPAHTPQPASTQTLTPATSSPACLPANAGGTVPPAIAICSITFVARGDLEQVVRDGDTLRASPGDEVRIVEIAICAGPFSGNGGEACVDFVPIDHDGREIATERKGTHARKVVAGCTSVPRPEGMWIVGENWHSISVVLNHWLPDRIKDTTCAGGLCERDDRVTISLE